MKKHISYSELKTWAECPYKRKLMYVDRVKKFIGNEFTAFGRALHAVCENIVMTEHEDISGEDYFDATFRSELKSLTEEDLDKKLVVNMQQQAHVIIPQIEPYLDAHFGSYEVFSVEEPLYEDVTFLKPIERKFKGFIDLVVKTDDGKYHIIDWKTCSWGWDAKKRSEPMVTYQLTLYKNFFCQKMNVDPKDVETHFALLKRTAKNNPVEFFRVTSGPRKTQNALKLLKKALYNIKKQRYIKNRLSCTRGYGCQFFQTEHCK